MSKMSALHFRSRPAANLNVDCGTVAAGACFGAGGWQEGGGEGGVELVAVLVVDGGQAVPQPGEERTGGFGGGLTGHAGEVRSTAHECQCTLVLKWTRVAGVPR